MLESSVDGMSIAVEDYTKEMKWVGKNTYLYQ